MSNGRAINTTGVTTNNTMSDIIDDDLIISPTDEELGENITFEPPIIDYTLSFEDTTGDSLPITMAQPLDPQHEEFAPQPPQQVPIVAFHKVPSSVKSPVGNYFSYINWDGDFRHWKLVRFATPMDGSCLFHAISNSFFEPYHTEVLNGKHVTRVQMVSHLRKELSQKLSTKISDDPNSPTHYDILNGGNTSAFAEAVPEFALNHMQDQLRSTFPIGYGYMEFIGNALNKDIYILEAIRRDIYITDELPLTIKGDRRSVVLYYMNGHYELVGVQKEDGTFDTHFSPEHSLIRFLYNRVKELTT